MKIEERQVEALIPYARNARKHSDAQVAQLAASIREFGFNNPVLVDGANGIIAGHGRVMAARKLGLEAVPVIELAHLTDAQRRAYILADNRIAELGRWDKELLQLEVSDLVELGVAEFTGFDDAELRRFSGTEAESVAGEDEAPAPLRSAVTRPGDVWALGAHRLICGDCTAKETVAALLGSHRPHLMVTDPPYGVSYDADWRNRADLPSGKNTARSTGRVLNDDRADWRDAWALFPGAVAYVWHAGSRSRPVAESLEAEGFEVRSQLIWAKPGHVISRGHYHAQHEPCFYAVRKGGTGHWQGDRSQTTLWEIAPRQEAATGHSTQKPVECMRRPILNNSAPGDAVYEPFCGSGSTLIACEATGRACLAVELSPEYCDIIVRRWEAFSGNTAALDGGAGSFEAVAAERGVTIEDKDHAGPPPSAKTLEADSGESGET